MLNESLCREAVEGNISQVLVVVQHIKTGTRPLATADRVPIYMRRMLWNSDTHRLLSLRRN